MAVGFARSLLGHRFSVAAAAGRGGTAWGAILRNSHPRRFRSIFTAWLQRRLITLLEHSVRAIVRDALAQRDKLIVDLVAGAPPAVICPNCRHMHGADRTRCPECGHGPADVRAQPDSRFVTLEKRLDAARREGFF